MNELTVLDGRRASKGTPERISICRAALAIGIQKRAAKILARRNEPFYDHKWLFCKVEGDPDGCWNFTGHKDILGYGKLRYRGKPMLAHRASFKITNGFLPNDLLVCHRCDNPSCINPQHLFLGTHYDNTMDAVKKGRKFIPNKSNKSKI